MSKPIIGLTTYGPREGRGYETPAEYVQAIVSAGGQPVLLPGIGAEPVPAWLALLDGVVLIGGGDIDPVRHASPGHETLYNLDAARDETELALAEALLAARLPTLAICRGLQILNTVLGGTLHVHLPDVVGDTVAHRAPPREAIPHDLAIAPESRLAAVLGMQPATAASWHHQAIDRLGQGLRPVAWAPDGVIEAVELDGAPYVLAVQWHPELSAAQDPRQQALFDALVALARKGTDDH